LKGTKMKTIPMPVASVCNFRDGNDGATSWNIPSTEFSLEACGRNGYATIKVSVHGYCYIETITMRVERKKDWRSESAAEWDVSLGHSSGGRMTTPDEKNYPYPRYVAIADDLEAEAGFGVALITTAAFGREIMKYGVELEAFYQQRRVELNAEREAEKAAKLAAVAADEPLGAPGAAKMIQKASELGMWSERCIVVYQRGAEHPAQIIVSRKQNTTYRFMGCVISRKKVIEELAQASARSHIEV
jgi:hypothetical protein